MDRVSGRFMRRFRMPENVKVSQVKTATANGVLILTISKKDAWGMGRGLLKCLLTD